MVLEAYFLDTHYMHREQFSSMLSRWVPAAEASHLTAYLGGGVSRISGAHIVLVQVQVQECLL